MRSTLVGLGLTIWIAAGCGPRVKLDEPTAFDLDDPAAQNASPEAPAPAPPPPAPIRGARTGTIPRASLMATLDAGPGMFLRGFEVTRQLSGGQFSGWRLVQFFPGEERFRSLDLHPGDVLLTVNDRTLARPEHLQALWEELRGADAIVVRLERDGAPFELRFDIVPPAAEAAKAAPTAAASAPAPR
jgi:hypothetical protein